MTRKTKHADSRRRHWDGHISPWPLVYLSHKNTPQPLKVRGCHIYKVTLKQRTGRLFELGTISRDAERNPAERESFLCRYRQNWKCTITESCGERLKLHTIILRSRGSFSCASAPAFTHAYEFSLLGSWTSSRHAAWCHYLHPESHAGPHWLMGLRNKENHGISWVQQRCRSLEGDHFVYLCLYSFIPFPRCCVVTPCRGAGGEWYLVWLLTAPLGEENEKRWW